MIKDALSSSISDDQDSFSLANTSYYNMPAEPPGHPNSYLVNSSNQFKPMKPIQEDAFGGHLVPPFGMQDPGMMPPQPPMMVSPMSMPGMQFGPGMGCLDIHSQPIGGFYDMHSAPCMGQGISEMQNDSLLLANELENKMNSQNLTSL